jgi:hypothetical protein
VIFGKLKTANGGTPFGVAARQIVSYDRRQVGAKLLVTSAASALTASDGGDACD